MNQVPLDFTTPALLLSEAGWKVTTFSNQPYTWDKEIAFGKPGIIAGPEKFHNKVIQTLIINNN